MRAKIKGREWEDTVRRLIAAEWTSTAISLYVRVRYGEDVDESTIRLYRSKNRDKINEENPSLVAAGQARAFADQHFSRDERIDALGSMEEMIRMQRHRIDVDMRHEQSMGKLFGSTKSEIKLLAELIAQYHRMMQDWGVVPRSGVEIDLSVKPAYDTQMLVPTIDLISEDDVDTVTEFAMLVLEKEKARLGRG